MYSWIQQQHHAYRQEEVLVGDGEEGMERGGVEGMEMMEMEIIGEERKTTNRAKQVADEEEEEIRKRRDRLL